MKVTIVEFDLNDREDRRMAQLLLRTRQDPSDWLDQPPPGTQISNASTDDEDENFVTIHAPAQSMESALANVNLAPGVKVKCEEIEDLFASEQPAPDAALIGQYDPVSATNGLVSDEVLRAREIADEPAPTTDSPTSVDDIMADVMDAIQQEEKPSSTQAPDQKPSSTQAPDQKASTQAPDQKSGGAKDGVDWDGVIKVLDENPSKPVPDRVMEDVEKLRLDCRQQMVEYMQALGPQGIAKAMELLAEHGNGAKGVDDIPDDMLQPVRDALVAGLQSLVAEQKGGDALDI